MAGLKFIEKQITRTKVSEGTNFHWFYEIERSPSFKKDAAFPAYSQDHWLDRAVFINLAQDSLVRMISGFWQNCQNKYQEDPCHKLLSNTNKLAKKGPFSSLYWFYIIKNCHMQLYPSLKDWLLAQCLRDFPEPCTAYPFPSPPHMQGLSIWLAHGI